MGDETSDKEPLYVYIMDRKKGVAQLDFILASELLETSPEAFPTVKILLLMLQSKPSSRSLANIILRIVRLFALSWNAPQQVDLVYRDQLQKTYTKELKMLQTALPGRFHPIIEKNASTPLTTFSASRWYFSIETFRRVISWLKRKLAI